MTSLSASAAIVCIHVAKQGKAVRMAVRDTPQRAEDSGWQFLCNGEEDELEAEVWSVEEVLGLAPDLEPFIDSPVGTLLARKDGRWTVLQNV